MNPYASPSTPSSAPRRAPFEPRPVARLICMILRGGNRPAKRDSDTGELILGPSRIAQKICWFAALGGPAGALILCLVDPPPPHEWWALWALGAFCLALGSIGIVAKERVYVSAERVRKEGPFFRRRTASWRDVVSVTISRSGSLTLVSTGGTRITVEPNLAGIVDFPDMLEQHLSPEIWGDSEADLSGWRRFVT